MIFRKIILWVGGIVLLGTIIFFMSYLRSTRDIGEANELSSAPIAMEGSKNEVSSTSSAPITPPHSDVADSASQIVQSEISTTSELDVSPNKDILIRVLFPGVEHEVGVAPESSVYDVLLALRTLGKVSFTTKQYSGMGYLITGINGVMNGTDGRYWVYLVNGVKASIGVSSAKVSPGDEVEWRFENEMEALQHAQ